MDSRDYVCVPAKDLLLRHALRLRTARKAVQFARFGMTRGAAAEDDGSAGRFIQLSEAQRKSLKARQHARRRRVLTKNPTLGSRDGSMPPPALPRVVMTDTVQVHFGGRGSATADAAASTMLRPADAEARTSFQRAMLARGGSSGSGIDVMA